MPDETFTLILFSAGKNTPAKKMAEGLSRKQAQAVCRDERTHGTNWFMGFTASPDDVTLKPGKDNGTLRQVFEELGIPVSLMTS